MNLLKGLTTNTSECADGVNANGQPCSSKPVLALMSDFLVSSDIKPPKEPMLITKTIEKVLGCNSESCVIKHKKLQSFAKDKGVHPDELKRELALRFKVEGPRNHTGLLSNFNIDGTLQQWGRVFTKLFPCPFAMMDFNTNGDLFGQINFADVLNGDVLIDLGADIKVRRPCDQFACVVNTDISSGPGKHWVAVFVDCRPKKQWTVEYFNSAGNPPPRPMVKWMEKTKICLEKYCKDNGLHQTVETVPVTNIDHQESETECGVYTLYYIRRRIENTPFTFFKKQIVPDDAMIQFRKHLFR